MITALVFDFDGLILDTEVASLRAWQELFVEHGCELPMARWTAGIGLGSDGKLWDPCEELERALGRAIERDALQLRRRARRDALLAAEAPRPGVRRYLDDARRLGLRLGVASSSPVEWVGGHLERLGLRAHFDCLRCFGDAPRAKPAPDLYLAALDGLGARPEQAIAFEDSPNGARAAKAAGIFTVAVPNPVTAALPFDEADLRLGSLEELPLRDLLERAAGRRAA